jgi:hypothetical protein
MAKQNDVGDRISILLCTANLGNAQPDQESWHQLVPNDGCCAEVAATPYPLQRSVSSDGNDTTAFLQQKGRQFDLIVFGLQEATFDPSIEAPAGAEETAQTSSESLNSSKRLIDSSHSETSSKTRNGLKAKLRSTRLLGKAVVHQTKAKLDALTASRNHLAPSNNNAKSSNGVQELRSLMSQRLPSYEHIV